MTDRKQELLDEETAKWAEWEGLVEGLDAAAYAEPVDDSGWTIKDIMWHLRCWTADAARELERIKAGTYEERDYDTDAVNAAWVEEGRDVPLDEVRAEWMVARTRAREAWGDLDQITPAAEEWFYEIGPEHFDEHIPQVRNFLERRG